MKFDVDSCFNEIPDLILKHWRSPTSMKIFDSNYRDFNYSDSSVFVGAKFVELMTYVLSLGIDMRWAPTSYK